MQKMQILFPDPMMKRLRDVSKREDRPISEIVRRATEAWLSRLPDVVADNISESMPVYRAGKVLVDSTDFRDAAYSDRRI